MGVEAREGANRASPGVGPTGERLFVERGISREREGANRAGPRVSPALRAEPCQQRRDLREGNNLKCCGVSYPIWLKSRQESGLSYHATFARERYVRVGIIQRCARSPATSATTCEKGGKSKVLESFTKNGLSQGQNLTLTV